MKKIKVLELVDSIQFGGVEQNLYNYIVNMDLEKFDFTIVTTGKRFYDAEKKFSDLNINIYGLPLKKENFIKYLLKLNRIINKGNFDVVHSHLNYWSCIPLYFAKKNKVKLKISHVHGTFHRSFVIKVLSSLTILFSDIRLACGTQAGKSIYGNKSFEVLDNGIDIDKFKYNDSIRKKLRKSLGISESDFVIGHIGRFYPVKNHKFIFDCFSEYHKNDNNSKLVLIGDGDLFDDFVNEAKKMRLVDSIFFLGSKNNASNYYNVFDVFILPSISEGFPLTLIEAQSNGLKCLVSDTISRDVNITGNVVFVSNNDIKLWNKLLNDKKSFYRKADAFNIIKKSKYNIENSVKRLENIYQYKK